jgi:two-component system response regulator RegA
MLKGFGSIPAAREAVRGGVQDFLTKPTDADQILAALDGQSSLVGDGEHVLSLDQMEWEHLQRVLAQTGNNISQAAKLLGIDRRSLQRKLSKFSPH